jgi:hypothetical protein
VGPAPFKAEPDKTPAQTCNPMTFQKTGEGWNDPVHQHMDDSWHFCDETWSDCIGPYATEQECRAKLKEYAEYLTNGEAS